MRIGGIIVVAGNQGQGGTRRDRHSVGIGPLSVSPASRLLPERMPEVGKLAADMQIAPASPQSRRTCIRAIEGSHAPCSASTPPRRRRTGPPSSGCLSCSSCGNSAGTGAGTRTASAAINHAIGTTQSWAAFSSGVVASWRALRQRSPRPSRSRLPTAAQAWGSRAGPICRRGHAAGPRSGRLLRVKCICRTDSRAMGGDKSPRETGIKSAPAGSPEVCAKPAEELRELLAPDSPTGGNGRPLNDKCG
jgi:hypothetical protein